MSRLSTGGDTHWRIIVNLSKDKLLFDASFGQDGAYLEGDSILLGISAYSLAGATKSLLRGDESGRIEVVGPTAVGIKTTLAAATIDPGVGLGASRTAGIATITTTLAHGFVTGDVVVVSGVTDPTFDGTYIVESVPLATTFTYHNAGINATSEAGSALDQTRNPRPLLVGAVDGSGNAQFLKQYVDGVAWGAGSAGFELLAVRHDTAGPLIGVADGDWTPLEVDANGALKVSGSFSVSPADNHVESAAHTAGGGDTGSWGMSFRQDALANQATIVDGDYVGLKSNDRGALWVAPVGTVADDIADTENPVKVGTKVRQTIAAVTLTGNRADLISDMYRRLYVHDSPNRVSKATATVAGLAAVALPGSPLAGRTRVQVQNLSNKDIYLGDAAVSTASGLRVSPGATESVEIGDQCILYAIAGTAALDVRVLELA